MTSAIDNKDDPTTTVKVILLFANAAADADTEKKGGTGKFESRTIQARLSAGSTTSCPVLRVHDLLIQADLNHMSFGIVAPNGSSKSMPISEECLLHASYNLIHPTDGPIRDVHVGGTVIVKPLFTITIKNALWMDNNVKAVILKFQYIMGTQPRTVQDMINDIVSNASAPSYCGAWFDLNEVPAQDIGLQTLDNSSFVDPTSTLMIGRHHLARLLSKDKNAFASQGSSKTSQEDSKAGQKNQENQQGSKTGQESKATN